MRVEYSRRAVDDLRKILADSRQAFGLRVAEAFESRIRAVVDRVGRDPHSAPEIEQRPGIHVVPLSRYPFKVFYRVVNDRVTIMHIRHTVRRPWRGGG
jgi:plasmid stabilization system protein ParE